MADINSDLALMREIRARLEELHLVEEDSKGACLVEQARAITDGKCEAGEPFRKLVIFSEYVDTVNHLKVQLEVAFPERVLVVAGALSSSLSKDILRNFDASLEVGKQRDDYQILLTSDKLSEGVNLNRAGAVINYDIPWNPTRVIQRVGRINRIGKKVFETLYIYNFFPTEKGADIIKSREIASQKMFLIHATLGEDAKIFDVDEVPAPAELFRRVNKNPEEGEEESLFTYIRKTYFDIKHSHPEVVERVSQYPARVKTAKTSEKNQLAVFRRKGLGLFIQSVDDTLAEKPEVRSVLMEEGLGMIECSIEEPRLALSKQFWPAYETIKTHREVFRVSRSENSLEVKALSNLQCALNVYKTQLEPLLPFIRTLVKDLRDYRTLPKFTLRRLVGVDLKDAGADKIAEFKNEIEYVRRYLGEDYLDVIQQRMGSVKSEVIIAVENQKI
jgi:hypothetical protein